MIQHNFKQTQKEFYNGRRPEFEPPYLDLQAFRKGVESRINDAKNLGYIGLTLKEIKNKKIFDTLGFSQRDLVLDIGCSTGNLLNMLNVTYGIRGIGIDMSSLAVLRGTQVNPCENRLIVADAEELPFADNSVDYVISFDVFEHLPHPEKCTVEISRVLKGNGKVLVYVVSKKDRYTWHWILKKLTFNRFGVFGDSIGGHDRERFLYAEDIVKEMERNDLEVERVIYFHSLLTLAYDENIPRLIGLLGKFYRLFMRDKNSRKVSRTRQQEIDTDDIWQPSNSVKNSFKKLLAIFSHLILPVLEFIDKVNSSRGYSNGFYVQAKKPSLNSPLKNIPH